MSKRRAFQVLSSSSGSVWALPESKAVLHLREDRHPDVDKVCRIKGCKEIPSPYHNYSMGGDIIPWGTYNDMPHRLQRLVMSDKDAPHLLRTNFNFLVGKDICAYRNVFEDGEKREVLIDYEPLKAWKKKVGFEWQPYITGRGKNLALTLNAFSEFVLQRGPAYPETMGRCYSVRNIDSTCIRLCAPVKHNGKVTHCMIYSEEYPEGQKVPLFDPKRPNRYAKFVYHTKDIIVGSRFYAYPDFIGAEDTLEIRREFNCYHLSGFKNGWTVKYHIEVSLKMVEDLTKKINAGISDKAKHFSIQDVYQSIIDELDKKLSGSHNSQKNLFTKFLIDEDGNFQGVKITALKQEMDGSQYIELAKFAQQNNAASFGVANAIAGIETQGKLGNASELRNHINFHVTYKAYQMRLLFLRDMEIVKMVNGWDEDVHFKILDHPQPVTTDVSKTGLQKT